MGSVFLLGVPVMALLLVLGPRLLPEYRDRTPGRIDLPAPCCRSSRCWPSIYGLKTLAERRLGAEPLRWMLSPASRSAPYSCAASAGSPTR